jgi:hypothetical protein
MKVKRKEGSSVVTGVIRACAGPLASDGLDEALGLTVGLGAIGSGEAVGDAELLAGDGEELGAARWVGVLRVARQAGKSTCAAKRPHAKTAP